MYLTFANPAGWWALLGIPAILVLHLFQRRSRRLRTSTLFLLEHAAPISAQGRRRERLRNSPLLWLQLLAVALLAWILAGPLWLRPASVQQTVLVLDGSSSMLAFLAEARQAVAKEVRRIEGSAAHHEWIALDSDLTAGTIYRGPSASALLAALDTWRPRSRHHDPAPAFALARGLAGGRALVAFVTDRPPERLPPDVSLLAVGSPIENVGFIGLEVQRGSAEAEWSALVMNHGAAPARRRYGLEVAGQRVSEDVAELPAGGVATLRGRLPAGVTEAVLRLEPDTFTPDDTLPMLVPAPKRLRAFLSAPPPLQPLMRRLLRSLDNVDTGAMEDSDFMLGVLQSGNALPERSGVFVLDAAPPQTPLLTAPVVAARHPWMAGLGWGNLICADLPGLVVTNPVSVLLWGGDRPLIFLREDARLRQLVFNLDAAGSSLERLPAFPLLVRRFVEAVREAKPAPEARNVELQSDLTVSVLPGTALVRREDGAAEAPLPVSAVGTVALRAPALPAFFEARDVERVWFRGAAHFADAREAAFLDAAATNTLAAATAAAARANYRDDPLGGAWIVLLAGILAATWILAARRGA